MPSDFRIQQLLRLGEEVRRDLDESRERTLLAARCPAMSRLADGARTGRFTRAESRHVAVCRVCRLRLAALGGAVPLRIPGTLVQAVAVAAALVLAWLPARTISVGGRTPAAPELAAHFVGPDAWYGDAQVCRVGDADCNGIINDRDVDAFVLALAQPDRFRRDYPECDLLCGKDADCDGGLGLEDIGLFLTSLLDQTTSTAAR